MHHEHLDKYSRLNSVIHKIDARVKLIFGLILVVVASVSNLYILTAILVFLLIIILLSKVPLSYIITRYAICLPFLFSLFLIPFPTSLLLIMKAVTSITVVTAVISTTKFQALLNSMKYFRVPKIFILMLSFFYRYIFLFIDNVHRMLKARDSRSFSNRQRYAASLITKMIGSLFIQSYEQSERAYAAMLARGYSG
ncbi:hypothetical protein K9M79_00575 [Candidatus Woesearchaeota archaeon]|nr:hypothetical protein [Candidatus Woesearchaeota archaeon]